MSKRVSNAMNDCFVADMAIATAAGKWQKTQKQTVFDRITASPEVLAEEFVDPYTWWGEDGHLETRWRSNFRELSGMLFDTREEAIAATVARLKEVADA